MKTAEELLRELVDDMRAPKGCPIKLKEWPATELMVRNCIAICGDMPAPERARYDRKVVQLRQKNPQVDWSAVM